jgi:type VI secretion system protein ImpG
MMEELLPHYERELARLRRAMRTFATDFPKVAARLAIAGEHSEDPHVDRMLQSFALLGARLDVKLEDDYPEFTEAMLEVLLPQYLRPFPSCSIVQFDIRSLINRLSAPRTLPRGQQLTSHGSGYSFRSAYDVVLAPLEIADARYALTAFAPMGVSLPPDATGVMSITFAFATENTSTASLPDSTRIHLSGQREIVAALIDGLLLRATAAFVEPDGRGQWKPLRQLPVSVAGFDDVDALLDRSHDAGDALGPLMEYFAFPDKFDFVDIDLAALRQAAGPCRRLTLHLAITGVHADSRAGQRMAKLSAENLKLFCTPVVNLFQCEAAPIETKEGVSLYPIEPQAKHIALTEVWSVDAVRLVKPASDGETVIHPFLSMRHGSSRHLPGPYWAVRCDDRAAQVTPGYETELALVRLDGQPVTTAPMALAIDLTCTNRDLPRTLEVGVSDGDLELAGSGLKCPIVLLRRPTASARAPRRNGALWRIIAHMTPQTVRLGKEGIEELKQLFRQFAALSASQARHIEGIASLRHRTTMQWIVGKPSSAFARGIEVTMTLDEQAFAGSSLRIFAEVMDRFLAVYASTNNFVQLVILSANTGVELRRCAPRQGVQTIL